MSDLFELLTWSVLIPWLLGMVFGIFVGSTPGLTATMAVALLVPLSYQFSNPTAGLAMIIGVSFTAIFAGDIPATFLRIPGTPASTAATLDAHQLARQGRPFEALKTNLVCSSLGGLVGVLALMMLGPLLAKLALRFDDYEYFWLMILGLCLCVFVSGRFWFRGLLSATLGVLIAMIGLDSVGNTPRFTFPEIRILGDLVGGIGFIPAMIGLFGLAEALRWSSTTSSRLEVVGKPEPNSSAKAMINLFRNKGTFAISAVLGTIVGALPGAGADIAAWASYGVAQRIHRGRIKFGEGAVAGVVAPTSANNAAVAGAWIPALVFGLPGDTVTAIVIGAFSVYNIQPGPESFAAEGSEVQRLLWIALLTQFLLIPAGWLGIRAFGFAMRLPRPLIQCAVIVFSFVGAYAVSNSMFDVWVMVGFAFLGLFLESRKIPLTPLILGMILGGKIESHWRKGMISSQGEFAPFFQRLECQILIAVLVLALAAALFSQFAKLSKRDTDEGRAGSSPSEEDEPADIGH